MSPIEVFSLLHNILPEIKVIQGTPLRIRPVGAAMNTHKHTSHLLGTLLLCAALSLPLAACGDDPQGGAAGGGDPAAGGMPAPKVTAAKPLLRDVREWNEFTGRFEATDTVEIRARVNGYIQSISFKDGALVKKGDLLFVIDPRPFQAVVAQRQADLKAAQSRIELAKNTFDRAQSLFNSGDISAQIMDQRKSEHVQAVAAVDQARAALAAAQLDLSYTQVRAPIDGRISRQLVSQGNLINAGQDVLTTLVSIDPIHFYFDVDEATYLKYARMGEGSEAQAREALIGLADETGFPHTAKLDFVDNAIAESTGTMRGRAIMNNPDGLITPGMFGRVRLVSGKEYQAVQIPDEAIGIDQSRKFVMTVGPDGTVASKTITTGPVIDGLRVIHSGLDGSETVIINGLQRVQEGVKVNAELQELKASPETSLERAPLAATSPETSLEDAPSAAQETAPATPLSETSPQTKEAD